MKIFFIANSSLLPLLKEYYKEVVNDLQLATVSDIDSIGNAIDKKENVLNLLFAKVDSVEFESQSIVTYLESIIGRDNRLLANSLMNT